jgi:hypothetical protein
MLPQLLTPENMGDVITVSKDEGLNQISISIAPRICTEESIFLGN